MKRTVTTYVLVCSLLAILTVSGYAFYSIHEHEANEYTELHEKLESVIKTFWQLLQNKGTDFRIVDDRLYAGGYLVNGNFELPDKVQDIFGVVATIFMNDVRVSTNVLDAEGKRALGTRLTGPAYDAIFKQGKPYRGEAPILGTTYMTAYDPIRDRNGAIVGVLFVGVKVSDFVAPLQQMKMRLILTLAVKLTVFAIVMLFLGRAMKRIEDANETQLRFQQTLIETIPSPIFYKDADCRYLGCNRAFEEYVGFRRDELIGKKPHELWGAELADRYQKADMSLLENPGLQNYEASVRYADDTIRQVVFNKATFEGHDGKVAGLVGVILDITERMKAEEATQNAYQQMMDIVEFLPDATFVVDRNRRVIAWNRAIEKMTGVDKQDMIGKDDYSYAIPFYNDKRPLLIDLLDCEQERLRFNYAQIKREGHTLFTEVFVPSFRNGGGRYFWATATPLFDQQGNREGAIESIRDITDYKKAEEERAHLASHLHHGKMMETLMARLGHDLRTPLTPLFVLFPLMKVRVGDDPKLLSMIDICTTSATAMKRLVDRAHTLVSLLAPLKPEQLGEVALFSVVTQVVADNADAIGRMNAVIRNDIDPMLNVTGVPEQLRELFSNLISNAVSFSPKNGEVRISAEPRNGVIEIAVQDHGVGIAPENLEHIFDEFFKVDESRHDIQATGLGLSICKRIVLNHNGRIWAESRGAGKGTIIRFTLAENSAYNRHDEPKESI